MGLALLRLEGGQVCWEKRERLWTS